MRNPYELMTDMTREYRGQSKYEDLPLSHPDCCDECYGRLVDNVCERCRTNIPGPEEVHSREMAVRTKNLAEMKAGVNMRKYKVIGLDPKSHAAIRVYDEPTFFGRKPLDSRE